MTQKDIALEKIATQTNESNYMENINILIDHPNSSELEVALYISEIASPEFKELNGVIKTLLKTYKDQDSIEELEEALQIIS